MPLSQTLHLRLRRYSGRPSVLHVYRADGTETWAKLYPGLEAHDLAHYAVETVLALDEAFFGLLARGYDIGDFEAVREHRPEALLPANLPPVSLQVEHLVNLLLTERQDEALLPDFRERLARILEAAGLPPLEGLGPAELGAIRAELDRLVVAWAAVGMGETLDLRMD